MCVTEEIPFSQLVQHPKDTMSKLEGSPRRRIRLDRRDGEDLILESADRADAEDRALGMASRMFISLMKHDPGARAFRHHASAGAAHTGINLRARVSIEHH